MIGNRRREASRRVQREAFAATTHLRLALPGWRPTPEQLAALDEGAPAYSGALRLITDGWSPDDARWDVLQGVVEYNRRQPPAPTRRQAPAEPWWWEYAPELLAGAQLVCLAVGAVQSRRKA